MTILFFSWFPELLLLQSQGASVSFPPLGDVTVILTVQQSVVSVDILNVLNEKLRTLFVLSTAVVFSMGSKIYKKPPPEGNIVTQVVRCIWVSS